MSNWVWHSTEASRTEGTVSILAIVETLFFVLLTWGVAVYFNFYYYLFAPLVLTPFLMLKTPESVESTHHIFLYEIDSHPLSKRFVLVISAIISLIILIFLPINSNLAIVSFLVIFLFVLVFVTKIVLAGGKNAIEKSINEFVSENKYISIFSSFILAIFLFYTGKFDLSYAMLMFVIASFAAFFWDGIMSGNILIIRSLFIKIFVTLERSVRRPIYTLQHLPDNWFEQVLINDIFYSPELLPGISKYNSDFQLFGLIQYQNRDIKFSEKIFRYILAFFWSLTYLYRWSIKSTAWFYWPLAFVFNKRPLDDKIKGKTYIDDQTNPLTRKGYIVIGAILVINFMGSIVSLDKLGNIESSVAVIIELFQSISINHPVVKTIIQPETWWIVLSATVIYFILYVFSTIQQHRRSHNNPEYSETFNVVLHWFIRLKDVLWIAFFAINLFFIANQHVWPIIFRYLFNT